MKKLQIYARRMKLTVFKRDHSQAWSTLDQEGRLKVRNSSCAKHVAGVGLPYAKPWLCPQSGRPTGESTPTGFPPSLQEGYQTLTAAAFSI